MTGLLASSKAGHDKDKIYVIIREDKEYVWLADGKYKTNANLKKKRKKHKVSYNIKRFFKSCKRETTSSLVTSPRIMTSVSGNSADSSLIFKSSAPFLFVLENWRYYTTEFPPCHRIFLQW